jgi:hypothetical protein
MNTRFGSVPTLFPLEPKWGRFRSILSTTAMFPNEYRIAEEMVTVQCFSKYESRQDSYRDERSNAD